MIDADNMCGDVRELCDFAHELGEVQMGSSCVSIALVAAIGQTESRCAINKSCVRFKLIILDFSWFAQFDVSSGLGSGCAHADHLACLVYIVCRSVSGINCETRSLVDFNHAWSLGFVDSSCLSGF